MTSGNGTLETIAGGMSYSCPRCGAAVVEPFYGPCSACRVDLRATVTAPAPAAEPATAVTVSGIVTTRRHWSHKRRPVVFVTLAGGYGIDGEGRRLDVPAGATLGQLLDVLAAYRMVYVCDAEAAAEVRAFFTEPAAGWVRDGMYPHDLHPSVTMADEPTGAVKVRLAPAHPWSGGPCDPVHMAEAWRWCAGRVADDLGGQLLATPSTTGRDLMARSFPRDVELPVLADSVADEIRATSTQHRMELAAGAAGLEVAGMVEADMRLAFAAVLRELPAGRPERMSGEPDTYDGHRHGRYRCAWTVPDHWNAPGILPNVTDDGWRWECRPGHKAAGWVDASELQMARRYGWSVDVYESLLWPRKPQCDPLRTFHGKLTSLYREAETAKGLSDQAAAIARKMVRSIIIHGIGALRGNGESVTRSCTADEAAAVVPAGADWWTAPDGSVLWTERRESQWQEWCRPEWTAAVWARTRGRLMDGPGARNGHGRGGRTGAMNLPPGITLYGFRGDALYLSDDPQWADDGQAGRYRIKAVHGPFTMPATLAELDKVRRRATAPPAKDAIANVRAQLKKGIHSDA